VGRPREFNEDEVLKAAGELFCARGYEGTSTRDLAESTGLTPSSIYAAFGDKRGLYLRALDQYIDRTLRERITRLELSLSPGRAIAGFFREVVDRSLADRRHRGCLLVNTALEATSDDPELQRLVANETIGIERFFHRCIAAGQRSGEIVTDQPADTPHSNRSEPTCAGPLRCLRRAAADGTRRRATNIFNAKLPA
jgi:TetR/AcrR family transcriptional regulator, transcriptional repressor for nem operon